MSQSMKKFESLLKQLDCSSETLPEFSTLIAEGNYPNALLQIDKLLATTPNDPKIKLWWVKCQLVIGSVPFMALSAPLEEMNKELKENPKLSLLSANVHLYAAERLFSRQQHRLGVTMFQRAFLFARTSNSISTSTQKEMKYLLIETLEDEIERAEANAEKRDYINELQKKFNDIKSVLIEEPESNPKATSPKGETKESNEKISAKTFTSKSIIDAAKESSSEENIIPEKHENTSHSSNLRNGIIIVAVIILLSYGTYSLIPEEKVERTGNSTKVALHKQNPIEKPAEAPPKQEKKVEVKANPVVEALKAAGERMKEIGNNIPEEPTEEKEVIDIEPEPPATYDPSSSISNNKFGTPEIDPDKTPELNPALLGNTKVEELTTSAQIDSPSGRQVNKDSLRQSPDGRVFAPEVDDPNASPYKDRQELDGSPLHAYKVEILKTPVLYRTITATDVLSQPSYVSRSVVRLEANAKIQVVAKMGKWLELRSQQGRRGYILAQDAIAAEQ